MVPCDKRCEETLGCGHQCTGVCGEKCPGSNLCQTCGPVTVLERQVDFVTFQNYKDIDADKDPLIFLSCGHFYTRSTLDGIMELTDYYNIDPSTGTILGPKPLRRILTTKTPGCPECREPLRDIHRYNRIVKKTLLDESTKKFVVRSNGLYRGLIGDIQAWEMDVQSEKAGSLLNWSKSTERSGNSSDATFSVIAFRDKTKKLQQKIDRFIRSMAAVEQPYGRVNELLKVAISRQKSIKSDFLELNESAIQTGFEIRGQCLQLRLNWLIFWAYEVLYTSSVPDQSTRDQLREEVASRIGGILKKCRSVRDSSQAAKHLPQQVEAMIYHVLFSLMQLRGSKEKDDLLSDLDARQIRQRASEMINECEALLLQNPGQLGYLKDDIEKARRQLDGGVFYSFVTTEEKRQIYEAMATQFSGTGHWYYCRNNHPVRQSDSPTTNYIVSLTFITIVVYNWRMRNAHGRSQMPAVWRASRRARSHFSSRRSQG